ncbi:MAG: hypothetical protein ACI3YK_07505 [Eubacteriales bacterium]
MSDFLNHLFLAIMGIAVCVLPLAGLVWIVISVLKFFFTPKTDRDKRRTRGILALLSLIVTAVYLTGLVILMTTAASHM